MDSGRTIIGGIEYDFGHIYALDHSRGLIYLVESRDPYLVEARSLEDGSVVGRYGHGRGEGPGEVETIAAIATGPEGVFVADGRSVPMRFPCPPRWLNRLVADANAKGRVSTRSAMRA